MYVHLVVVSSCDEYMLTRISQTRTVVRECSIVRTTAKAYGKAQNLTPRHAETT